MNFSANESCRWKSADGERRSFRADRLSRTYSFRSPEAPTRVRGPMCGGMAATRGLLIAALLLWTSIVRGEPGVIHGRVPLEGASTAVVIDKYSGKISGKVAQPPRPVAAVWLEAPELRAPPAKSAVMEQRDYQFSNGMLVIPVGTLVEFPNMDPDYHNVFSLSKAKRFDLGRYKPGEKPSPVVTFDKPGVVRLFCEIHEHMRGTIVVVDSPYFTRATEDGSFRLGGILPGSYTLRVWLDEKRNWQQPVTAASGRSLEVNLPAK